MHKKDRRLTPAASSYHQLRTAAEATAAYVAPQPQAHLATEIVKNEKRSRWKRADCSAFPYCWWFPGSASADIPLAPVGTKNDARASRPLRRRRLRRTRC